MKRLTGLLISMALLFGCKNKADVMCESGLQLVKPHLVNRIIANLSDMLLSQNYPALTSDDEKFVSPLISMEVTKSATIDKNIGKYACTALVTYDLKSVLSSLPETKQLVKKNAETKIIKVLVDYEVIDKGAGYIASRITDVNWVNP